MSANKFDPKHLDDLAKVNDTMIQLLFDTRVDIVNSTEDYERTKILMKVWVASLLTEACAISSLLFDKASMYETFMLAMMGKQTVSEAVEFADTAEDVLTKHRKEKK